MRTVSGLTGGWRLAIWSAALGAAACGSDVRRPASGAAEAARLIPDSASAPTGMGSLLPVVGARLSPEQQRGRAVYDAYCWTCHGLYGHGDGPLGRGFRQELPELAPVAARLPAGEIVRRMRQPPAGATESVGGSSVWHSLGADEVRAAVAYIATFAPRGSRGNPEAGRLIYGTYCVHCHGTSGAGDGRLARSLAPPPADLRSLDLPGRANQVFAALKAGGSARHGGFMPEWGKLFGDQQLWDVIAYLPGLTARR